MDLKDINNFSKLPITILSSFGHNGLDWIHSLLDDHPEAIIMPAYSFYRTLDFYSLETGKDLSKINNNEIISEEFTHFIINDPSYNVVRRRFLKDENEANIFCNFLNEFLSNSSEEVKIKKLFLGINYAFCKSKEINLQEKKIIISQEHVSWHTLNYKKKFNSKFVLMMRDPRAGLAGAWKRQSENQGRHKMNPFDFDKTILAGTYLESFHKNLSVVDKRKTKVMINEEMHIDLKKEMMTLCNWLGINFYDSCLEESFLGKEWLGESSYLGVDELKERPPLDFYEPKNVESRWRGRLSQKEINMIETIFAYSFEKFGYVRDFKPSLKNKIKGFVDYFFSSLSNVDEAASFILFLKIMRNFSRRICVKFFPTFVPLIFKIP